MLKYRLKICSASRSASSKSLGIIIICAKQKKFRHFLEESYLEPVQMLRNRSHSNKINFTFNVPSTSKQASEQRCSHSIETVFDVKQ